MGTVAGFDRYSEESEDLVEHFVHLSRWPEGLQLPADLGDRIRYDADRGRLVYKGFMSKSEFDRLSRLSDDWAYLRPLEDLFRLCTQETAPRGRTGIFRRVGSAFGPF
jgi:hypothetical protein